MRTYFVAASLLAGVTSASATPLSGDDIRRDIVGRNIYLAAPLGGEFPLNYRTSGRVDGDGAALGLGRFIRPRDSGRWWISGNRLCQQFSTWYDGSPMCFDLTRAGPNRLNWVRDNGQRGTARIGAALAE
ncbi:MAG: hypothetical protein WCH83_07365 [Alphaproteobacteria bacterium]